MSPDQLSALKKRLEEPPGQAAGAHGIGLANVYQRMVLEYGADCGLQIDSAAGAYTTVTLRIPRGQI